MPQSAHISVIIPTYNRAEALQRTAASIAKLEFPAADFEILVVDNGSTDATLAVFETARLSSPKHNWRYIHEPVPGLLSARHRGALQSQGDICAFIDDDVRVGDQWLSAVQEAFADPSVALVGGPSTPIFEASPPDWLCDFYVENEHGRYCMWLSLFHGGERPKEIASHYVFGLNFNIRKSVLRELGGFHPDCIPKPLQRFQGDGETGLARKLDAEGLKAFYHPIASVQHEVPRSRLSIEYLAQRGFYQGVADSYTCVRRNGRAHHRWKVVARSAARDLAARLRRRNSFAAAVFYRIQDSQDAGYSFHQSEVRHDPKLLAWVLRENYWDYRLPAGWENYLGNRGREPEHLNSSPQKQMQTSL